jgi:hypothetical protein
MFLGFTRSTLASRIVPRIRYLGFTTREKKGLLTTTGDLSACKSTWSLIRLYTVNNIHLSARKLYFGCCALFCPTNLPEPLHAIVGANMSSFQARSGRTRGIVGTWKQVVTQLFLRKVLPANHQGRTIRFWINPNEHHLSFSSLFTTRKVSPCETSTSQSFLNQNFPLLYLLSPYLNCSFSTSIAMRMNSYWRCIFVSNFIWICKWTNPSS